MRKRAHTNQQEKKSHQLGKGSIGRQKRKYNWLLNIRKDAQSYSHEKKCKYTLPFFNLSDLQRYKCLIYRHTGKLGERG